MPDRRIFTEFPLLFGREPSIPQDQFRIQSVIDDGDNWREVEFPWDYPFQSICRLRCEFTAPNGRPYVSHGTGWLAGPRTVVTAAHNVFQRGWQRFPHTVVVEPGRKPGAPDPAPDVATRCDCLPEYRDSQKFRSFDVGVVHLTDGFPALHPLAYAKLSDAALRALRVSVSGYLAPVAGNEVRRMMHHSKEVQSLTPARLYYRADTEKGQSGSPVWGVLAGESEACVVGIHNWGTGETPPGEPDANMAVRIDEKVFDTIRGWIGSPLT